MKASAVALFTWEDMNTASGRKRQDAVSSTAEQPQPSAVTLSHDLMSSPTSAEVAALWSEWTPATLIEHLIAETTGQPLLLQPPQQQRILRRHAVHQLMNLLPHLPEKEQAMTLRRLRRILVASQYNLHVCTAQLHLVDLLLRWLRPPALPPSEIVCSELLGLVGELGGYRVTMHELRTLFDLLRSSLDALRSTPDASRLAATPTDALPAPPPPTTTSTTTTTPISTSTASTITTASTTAAATSTIAVAGTCHATPEQLLQLLLTWCQPAVDASGPEAGPTSPRAYFDLDGTGPGLELPRRVAPSNTYGYSLEHIQLQPLIVGYSLVLPAEEVATSPPRSVQP